VKKHILFVDDEPLILEGLRNRLRRQRGKWEMTFVGSGREALKVLESTPVDVVVSDMRMPGMDGATLLKTVKENYPGVARIMLSGHAELESAVRAVLVAHQFLTKPCDVGVLENVIERVCSLQALLGDESVRGIVGGIGKLPPLPRVYAQLRAALTNDDTCVADVARILKQDTAICTKLLQVVNSAFFRLARTITRVEDAVSYLGFNSIKHIALAAEVFQYTTAKRTPIPLEVLHSHSILVGSLCMRFFTDKRQMEDAFLVGLLHDVGKLLLVAELPDYVDRVLCEMNSRRCPMYAAEISTHGVTHAEIGAYLLGLWGLPYPVVEAVANHHQPGRVDAGEFGVLAATHIADALVHEEAPSGASGAEQCPPILDLAFVESLGLEEKIPEWREFVREMAATTVEGACR